MSEESLIKFLAKLGEDEEFAKNVFRTKEKENVQKLAKEACLELSLEEINQAKKILRKVMTNQPEGELSEDELENVAGGSIIEFLYTNNIFTIRDATTNYLPKNTPDLPGW